MPAGLPVHVGAAVKWWQQEPHKFAYLTTRKDVSQTFSLFPLREMFFDLFCTWTMGGYEDNFKALVPI